MSAIRDAPSRLSAVRGRRVDSGGGACGCARSRTFPQQTVRGGRHGRCRRPGEGQAAREPTAGRAATCVKFGRTRSGSGDECDVRSLQRSVAAVGCFGAAGRIRGGKISGSARSRTFPQETVRGGRHGRCRRSAGGQAAREPTAGKATNGNDGTISTPVGKWML